MKTLKKLEINPEKLMNNEELVTLRGGYDGSSCCMCYSGATALRVMAATNQSDCTSNCHYAWELQYPDAFGTYSC